MKQFLAIFLLCILAGCKSCTNSLYGTNSYEFLNINFETSNLSGSFFDNYVDSVLNKGEIVPDSIKSIFYRSNQQHDLELNERLIHFRENPEEWYLIGYDTSPCWIEAIYNPQLSQIAIYKRERLSSADLERVRSRFENEILKGAEKYGKQNNIPDSVLYNK